MKCEKCGSTEGGGKLSIMYSAIGGGFEIQVCYVCMTDFLKVIEPELEKSSLSKDELAHREKMKKQAKSYLEQLRSC